MRISLPKQVNYPQLQWNNKKFSMSQSFQTRGNDSFLPNLNVTTRGNPSINTKLTFSVHFPYG